jgi:hypothetical protein
LGVVKAEALEQWSKLCDATEGDEIVRQTIAENLVDAWESGKRVMKRRRTTMMNRQRESRWLIETGRTGKCSLRDRKESYSIYVVVCLCNDNYLNLFHLEQGEIHLLNPLNSADPPESASSWFIVHGS